MPCCNSLRSGPSPKPIPSRTLPSPPSYQPQQPAPSQSSLTSSEFVLSSSSQQLDVSSLRLLRQPSEVSFQTRSRNRAAALAALEGQRVSILSPQPRNFMSMSDDEDEDEDESVDSVVPHLDTEDDEDYTPFFNPSSEPEDIVLPADEIKNSFPFCYVPCPNDDNLCGCKSSQRRVKPKPRAARRFHESFIDLYDNDDDYGSTWRSSFIRVPILS